MGWALDTVATAISINISAGMKPSAHNRGCERAGKTKGQLSRRHSHVLMRASATVQPWCDVPTSLPSRFCCSETHKMLGSKTWQTFVKGSLFAKQPLRSEARSRMIMQSKAAVYQQGLRQLQHAASTCVHACRFTTSGGDD